MLKGINHITLAVHDLNESLEFYQNLLGCSLLAQWPQGAYLLAGDLWLALIVDPNCRTQALPEYTHLAWQVEATSYAACADKIRASGAPIWKENTSEGGSIYFEDPNGHKLEIHVGDLASRLKSARESPWEGLQIHVNAEELL